MRAWAHRRWSWGPVSAPGLAGAPGVEHSGASPQACSPHTVSSAGVTPFPLPRRSCGARNTRDVLLIALLPGAMEFMRVSFRSLRKCRSARGRPCDSLVF